jgi:hypothetical protein
VRNVQCEIVAVLGLLALFSLKNAFWIAALLLALIQFPDLSGPRSSIACTTAPYRDALADGTPSRGSTGVDAGAG